MWRFVWVAGLYRQARPLPAGAGFHGVPGRNRDDGTALITAYFKTKATDPKNGDRVQLAVYGGDACTFGDVCVDVQSDSVVPR